MSIVLVFGMMLFSFIVIAHTASAIQCPPNFKPVDQLCVPNNPFKGGGVASADNAYTVIPGAIKTLLAVSGSVAVLFLIIGGLRYITAGNNANSVTKAKATLINATIGLVVIVLSYVIVLLVSNIASNTRI